MHFFSLITLPSDEWSAFSLQNYTKNPFGNNFYTDFCKKNCKKISKIPEYYREITEIFEKKQKTERLLN